MTFPSTSWGDRHWAVALKADDHMYRAILGDMARLRSDQTRRGVLTARERQHLQRIAEGMTAEEVSVDLGVALETAKRTLLHARRRLGARNTAHAVAIALGEGLIEAPRRVD